MHFDGNTGRGGKEKTMTSCKGHCNQNTPELTERQFIILAAKVGSKLMPGAKDRKQLGELLAIAWYYNHSDE